MVDVTEDFLVKAKTYLGEEGKRVRNYFCCGLQDFSPEPDSYDVIWIQWVTGERPAARLPPWRLEPPEALELVLPQGGGSSRLPCAPRTVGLATRKVPLLPCWFNSVPVQLTGGGGFAEIFT